MYLNNQCLPINAIRFLFEMLTLRIATLQRTKAICEATLIARLCTLEKDAQRLRVVVGVKQKKLNAQKSVIQILRRRIVLLDEMLSNDLQRRAVVETQTDFSVAPSCVLLATDLVERISTGVQTD